MYERENMDIFYKIEQFSYRLAEKIGSGDSNEDVELYKYSIFMIFSNLFTIGAGLLIADGIGYLSFFVPCVTTYILLRVVGGGQHCETFQDCFVTSNIISATCCAIAILTKDCPEIMWVLSVFFAINIIPICPKPSTNSPTRGAKEDLRFRKSFALRLTLLIVVSLFASLYGATELSSSISSGIMVLCFVLSDFGESVVSKCTT